MDDRRRYGKVLDEAHAAARRTGVHFLECDTTAIGGIRFAGATLWEPDDPRHVAAKMVLLLNSDRPDVVVTHFEPTADLLVRSGARLWVYGHHHGFMDRTLGARRLIRKAGHANEMVDGEPARPDFAVEI